MYAIKAVKSMYIGHNNNNVAYVLAERRIVRKVKTLVDLWEKTRRKGKGCHHHHPKYHYPSPLKKKSQQYPSQILWKLLVNIIYSSVFTKSWLFPQEGLSIPLCLSVCEVTPKGRDPVTKNNIIIALYWEHLYVKQITIVGRLKENRIEGAKVQYSNWTCIKLCEWGRFCARMVSQKAKSCSKKTTYDDMIKIALRTEIYYVG